MHPTAAIAGNPKTITIIVAWLHALWSTRTNLVHGLESFPIASYLLVMTWQDTGNHWSIDFDSQTRSYRATPHTGTTGSCHPYQAAQPRYSAP